MANVFRMDNGQFTYFGNLDNDASVCLRRVWSMSTYNGQLFAGTLPGGNVMRRQAGRAATHDHALPSGCSFNPRCAHAIDRCRSEAPKLKSVHPHPHPLPKGEGEQQVSCFVFGGP